MEEGRAFTQRLYGNQQVPLADEKKRGLSYEREKQGPSPLFNLLPPIFFPFPVVVAAPTPVAVAEKGRGREKRGACQKLHPIQLQGEKEKGGQQKRGRKEGQSRAREQERG